MPVITGVGSAFVLSVLPVLLIGGLGYLVGRVRSLDLAPITALAVLVLMPAIVFDSLARTTLPRDLLSRLVLHVILQLAGVWLLSVIVARLVGWRGPADSVSPCWLGTLCPYRGTSPWRWHPAAPHVAARVSGES